MPLQSPQVTSAPSEHRRCDSDSSLTAEQDRSICIAHLLQSCLSNVCLFNKVLRPNTATSDILNYLSQPAKAGLTLKGANSSLWSQMRAPKSSTVVIEKIFFIPLKVNPTGKYLFFSRTVPDISFCLVVQCCHGMRVGRNSMRDGAEWGFQVSFQHQAAVLSVDSFPLSLFQDSAVVLTHQVKA